MTVQRLVFSIGVALALAAARADLSAHITLRATGPLAPSSYATVSLVVPNEWNADTTWIVLEVPDEFLKAGGRLSRVEFPDGWKVSLEKEEKPRDVYASETAARDKKGRQKDPASGTGDAAAKQREKAILDQLRRTWIKRVVFEGGAIPPDGFREFRLSLQLPERAGRYRFAATQVYADGREVKWVQLVEGADRPAPEIVVVDPSRAPSLASIGGVAGITALPAAIAALVIAFRRQRQGERTERSAGRPDAPEVN